jgi:hypothetical protein
MKDRHAPSTHGTAFGFCRAFETPQPGPSTRVSLPEAARRISHILPHTVETDSTTARIAARRRATHPARSSKGSRT